MACNSEACRIARGKKPEVNAPALDPYGDKRPSNQDNTGGAPRGTVVAIPPYQGANYPLPSLPSKFTI
jgi:hypothetical protein